MQVEGKKVYIGNLADSATKEDVEAFFSKFGTIETTWIARNPAGFAFVTYAEPADASEAVRGTDGQQMEGRTLRVELAKSSGPRRDRGDRRGGRDEGRRDDRRGGDDRRGDDRRAGDRYGRGEERRGDDRRGDDRRGDERRGGDRNRGGDDRRERSRSREGRRY